MNQMKYEYIVRGFGGYEGAFEEMVYVRPHWVTKRLQNDTAEHDLAKVGVEVVVNGYRRHLHPAKEWLEKDLGRVYSREMYKHSVSTSKVRGVMRGIALEVGAR